MNHHRKFFAAAASAALIASAVAPVSISAEEQTPSFIDVPENAWYAEAVQKLAEAGVFQGVGGNKFAPNDKVTNAQAYAALSKALGLDEENAPKSPFKDIEGHWAEKAVNALYEAGILKGDNHGKVAPNGELSRERLVVMLLRALNIQEDENAEHSFFDVPKGHWAEKAIATAVKHNITNGIGNGKFGFGTVAKRLELASFLYKETVRPNLPKWVEYEEKLNAPEILVEGEGMTVDVEEEGNIQGVRTFTFGPFSSKTGQLTELELDIYFGEVDYSGNKENRIDVNLPASQEEIDVLLAQVAQAFANNQLDSFKAREISFFQAVGFAAGEDAETQLERVKENVKFENGTWTVVVDTTKLENGEWNFLVAVKDDQGAQWGQNNYTLGGEKRFTFVVNNVEDENNNEAGNGEENGEDNNNAENEGENDEGNNEENDGGNDGGNDEGDVTATSLNLGVHFILENGVIKFI